MKLTPASGARQDLSGCAREFLANALNPLVFFVADQLQVFGVVIGRVGVDVMDEFVFSQPTPDLEFHNESMLTDVATLIRIGMVGAFQEYVAVSVAHLASGPSAILLHWAASLRDVFGRVFQAPIPVTDDVFLGQFARLVGILNRAFDNELAASTSALDHNYMIAGNGA